MSTPKTPLWKKPLVILTLSALLVLVLGIIRWATLPSPRYLWPKDAGDWSAWGTCLGAIGTVLAVVYAARTLKSTSEAQLHARIDRRLQMDFLEAKEAEDASQLRPDMEGLARAADDYGLSAEAAGAGIFVQNFSEHPFHEVQVFIPDTSLAEGVTLSNFEFWETELEYGESGAERKPRSWAPIEPPRVPLPGMNLFTLGTVPPGGCRRVTFDFSSDEAEWMDDWSRKSRDAADPFGRSKEKVVSITFVDRNGKTWQRTSRDFGKIQRIRFVES